MRQQTSTILLRTAAILWILWGLVHVLAGVLTLNFSVTDQIAAAIGGIADAVDPTTLVGDYPAALGGILSQHGFNLLWFGLVTTIGAVFVWRRSRNAVFFNAIVGGLADVGYFLFIDLGGYARFVPGTVMTIVSASAIIISLWAIAAVRQRA